MGMGESLANLDNLIAALDRICSPEEGLGISQRRVTISTVGLPEKIRKLAAMERQYHLAVSLHAPTEDLRNELVPVNETIGLTAVLEAADAYFERTGRQVTYEYVLLRGINDRPADAPALARLLEARRAHVNLIPYNPVAGLPYGRPEPEAVRPVRRDPPRPGRQRDGAQDQGPGHRRGLRPAPPAGGRRRPVGWASPASEREPGEARRAEADDRIDPTAGAVMERSHVHRKPEAE